MANLMLHCGSHRVTRDDLAEVPTPTPTRTWQPIRHRHLLELVDATVADHGFEVTSEAHGLWGDGSRYFGLLEVSQNGTPRDHQTVIGIRNSHDKAFSAAICLGSCVMVCDNLSFAGDVTLSRKHTRHVIRDLPELVDDAFNTFREMGTRQQARIDAYKHSRLRDRTAHDLIVQAIDRKIIPVTRLPAVVREWRTPMHAEFTHHGKSLWRLANAFSEAWKGSNLNTIPRRSQQLHRLLDRVCAYPITT